MVRIHEGKGGLTATKLDEIERILGVGLPSDYRTFMLEFNGGYPEPDVFSFASGAVGSNVDRFLAVYDGEYGNFLKYYENYKSRIPDGLLPIAHDSGGNLICICLRGDCYGQILFWDHENESDVADFSNVEMIADSFNDFLDGLFELNDR